MDDARYGVDMAPVLAIAEDDEDALEMATLWLEQEGFEIRAARNGKELVDALKNGVRPDVIVLDLMMPIMSGWDVWDWLRTSHLAHVPVIFWTASGLGSRAVGGATVIAKGDADRLLKACRAVLEPRPAP